MTYSTASRWQILKAKLFGRKIADKRQYGMTIYAYKGVMYVTEWEAQDGR